MADAPETERQAVEPDSREVLSVSQLNDRIASVVQDTPAFNGVRCIGEVTDLHQNSTALYFTLTDGAAELPCMIWANRYRDMDAEFEDGTEVILEGDIDYWVEGGKIDLKPWEVIVVGDGDQAAAVERLRSELEERGLTTGVHPAGFAAACLYKAGQEQGQWVTQRDVAETGNVTPTTVRTHHETLDELAV
nr:exodeoxyribonuclease VII large subunit [Halorussus aquaticus]